MASIQELQKRLDNKTFNPAELNEQQKASVDMAFKQGLLKGYANVGEVEKERNIGAKGVANVKEKKAQPFTTATKGLVPFTNKGIERSDLELVGDVAGGAYVYMNDMPKLFRELQSNPNQTVGINKMQAAGGKFDQLEKAFMKLPFVRNTKILSGAARVAGRSADYIKNLVKFPSKGLVMEAKAQLASAGGAGAGSLTYDIANMATDYNGAVLQDLSKVSNNDIKKLPYSQQMVVHSAEAMQNALFYNIIGSSLAPILGGVMRGMKGPLGLGSKESKELAEFAQSKNISMTIPAIAKAGSVGGRIITAYEKIFGVIPIVNTFAKRRRKQFEKEAFESFLFEVSKMAPIQQKAIMNLSYLPTMRDNFSQFFESIRANYDVVDKLAEKMNNPKFIPTTELRKSAKEMMDGFEAGSPEPFKGKTIRDDSRIPEYGASFKKSSDFADPFVDTINKVRGLDEFITPKEYQGLMKQMQRDFVKSGLEDPTGLFWTLNTAAKNDFNRIANANNIEGYMNSAAFKAKYDEILESTGQEAATEFVAKMQNDMRQFGDQLETANGFFSTVVDAFNSPLAKKITNTQANVFSTKAMMGILNPRKQGQDKMWENVISNVFKANDDGQAMKQLKYILGVDNPKNKVGKELFNRSRSIYLWDALVKSYDQQPKNVLGTLADEMAEARKTGVVDFKKMGEIFKAAGTETLEESKRFNPELALRYGIGEADTLAIKKTAAEAGEFNIVKFRNNIGYFDSASKEASINKWTEMYGGGQQGKEAANNLAKLIDVMEAEYGKVISDSNSYLMRRIMLSGPGQSVIAGGLFAGAAASGGIMGAVPLTFILAAGGYYLANPKSLKFLLDVYTDLERFEKAGKKASPTNVPKSMFRLLNWAAQEDKDFPNVDPKKIDFEEVTDYLLNKNVLIPQFGFSMDAINPELKDRFYPELKLIDKGTEAEAAGGVNFLDGSNQGSSKAEQVVNFIPPAPNNVSAPVAQPGMRPAYKSMAPQVFQPQYTPQAFKNLFPNDALGAAIVEQPNKLEGQ